MKVALFSNSYLPYLSGITLSMKTLKNGLEKLGHELFIVGPKYPGHKETDPQILRLPSVPATYPGYRLVFPYTFNIFKRLKEKKIDLIHAHQPFGVGLAALLLARRMKIPFVYTYHTLFSRYVHHIPFLPKRLAQIIITTYLTWFCNQADQIIVPSEMVRRLLVARKIKTPIKVVPTGLDFDQLPLQRSKPKDQSPKTLLYSGRLSSEKNVKFLLEAFPKIRQQVKDVRLVIIGGGPKEKEYRTLAKQIDSNISFTGQIPRQNVLQHCFAADLFVYASRTETQGLVLTEAKACGLPVVAVFGGGIADVVENGIDGYLVPPNQDQFVEHVVRLLKDDVLRREMGRKAKTDALARFSSKSVAKQIETLYNSLI